jgi:hypothetical protein
MTPGHAASSWTERRESMGKTIAQVSAELRIGHRYLEGIEGGNFSDFPERVFTAGFIRTYAKYLSLDSGPVLDEYERSIGICHDSEAAAQLRFGWIERDREKGSRRATYTVAAGAVLLIGVILAWVTLRSEHIPFPSPAIVLPSAPAVENAARPADNDAVAIPSGVDNEAVVIPSGVDNDAVAESHALPSLSSRPESASSVTAVGRTGFLAGPFQLFLEASDQTWVMYSFDDGDPIDVTLYAGDKINIQAEKRITLKLGNAGGVVGTLNGRRLSPFGERGQVRKFAFGK